MTAGLVPLLRAVRQTPASVIECVSRRWLVTYGPDVSSMKMCGQAAGGGWGSVSEKARTL